MAKQEIETQFGIKYRVIPLDENQTLFYPIGLVKGVETEDGFKTDRGMLPFSYDTDLSKTKYAVDMIYEKSELEFVYQYIEGDEETAEEAEDFISKYFYDDFKDTILYFDEDKKKGYTSRNEINLRTIREDHSMLAYVLDRALPSVVLNEGAVKELSEAKDLEQVKLLLKRYRERLHDFRDFNRNKGITRISVTDGRIDTVETSRSVEKEVEEMFKPDIDRDYDTYSRVNDPSGSSEVSYQGLRDYIKMRVFGHDEEIDTLAQILYMNYTALDKESVESILLVGPTGVGKTETVKAACEYLDLPSYSVNASNIVPQGIKGMSIEDVIVGLFENAGHDEKKAQRGLIFLDEFDKLNESDLETKAAVKNILLTFTAGGVFPIDNDRYTFNFDSSMTSKVYAGVFQDILENNVRHIGFNNQDEVADTLSSDEAMREKIIEKGYFSLEELSRISTLLGFGELDNDTKRRILLDSKLSELVKKRERYKRQFGVDLIADDSYLDAIIAALSKKSTGMRSVNNLVKRTINPAERALLEAEDKGYKRLVLTKDTVDNPYKFDLG